MITIDDIRNPQRVSGFDHVGFSYAFGSDTKPYYANKRVAPGKNGVLKLQRRATAEEAAQDYCDFVNSGQWPEQRQALNTAGHGGNRDSLPRDEEVEAALGVLRDARAQRQGAQGYVYCIGEEGYDRAVKIGFSTNPEARVAELQTGNSRKLVLLAKKPGAPEDEVALHQRFIKQNLIGEWFVKDPAILEEF